MSSRSIEWALSSIEREQIRAAACAIHNTLSLYDGAPLTEDIARDIYSGIVSTSNKTPISNREAGAKKVFQEAVRAVKRLYATGYWMAQPSIMDGIDAFAVYYQLPNTGEITQANERYCADDFSEEKITETLTRAGVPAGLKCIKREDQLNAETVSKAIRIIGAFGLVKVPQPQAVNIYLTERKNIEAPRGEYRGSPAMNYRHGTLEILRPIRETITQTLPDAGNDKLLRQICMLFNPDGESDKIYLSLTNYMKSRGLRDRKTAKERIIKELLALQSDSVMPRNREFNRIGGFVARATGNEGTRAGRGGLWWEIVLNDDFADYLRAHREYAAYNHILHDAMMKIPDAHKSAYKIAMFVTVHARTNATKVKDDTEQRLTVERLLSVTDIPTIEYLMDPPTENGKKKQGYHRGRAGAIIAARFMAEMDYLTAAKIITYELKEPTGATASLERARADYAYLIGLTAEISMNPPADYSSVRENRQARIEEAAKARRND